MLHHSLSKKKLLRMMMSYASKLKHRTALNLKLEKKTKLQSARYRSLSRLHRSTKTLLCWRRKWRRGKDLRLDGILTRPKFLQIKEHRSFMMVNHLFLKRVRELTRRKSSSRLRSDLGPLDRQVKLTNAPLTTLKTSTRQVVQRLISTWMMNCKAVETG